MNRFPRTTIEQWAILKTVVEEGGFAQAAERLNRSQSSVSYALARLQEGLGVTLLEPKGRRAVLSDTGRAFLADVLPLLDDLSQLETRARAMTGAKARVRLVVDSLYSKARLFAALREFSRRHPAVEVSLRETARLTLAELAEEYDLAILVADYTARYFEHVATVELIAVARSDHPLARKKGALHKSTLARYPCVDIHSIGPGAAIVAGAPAKIWHMSTVEAAITAVQEGLCYGWLPRGLIADDLARKTLVPLALEMGAVRRIPLGLTFAAGGSRDPAIMLLAELLMRDGRKNE